MKAEIVLPQTSAFELSPTRVQAFGIVRSGNKLGLLIFDANRVETQLPTDSELVGIISAPVGTHTLDVYDSTTDEFYQLGIVFPNTTTPDWVELATARREQVLAERAEERREREAERQAELESERLAVKRAAEIASRPPWYETARTWRTNDAEVVRRIAQANGLMQTRTHNLFDDADESVGTLVEDQNGNGATIEQEVSRLRTERGAAADDDFARERERAEEIRRSRM